MSKRKLLIVCGILGIAGVFFQIYRRFDQHLSQLDVM
jgi:hypothetical protein